MMLFLEKKYVLPQKKLVKFSSVNAKKKRKKTSSF